LTQWLPKLKSKKLILLVQLLVVASMLYVGLKENIPSKNQVHISKENGALVFGELGFAYSKQSLNAKVINQLNQDGFEIQLDFLPRNSHNNNFQFLFLLSNGNPSQQLLIAQYGDQIVAMNGDDYNYSRKLPRLRLPLEDVSSASHRLVLKVTDKYSQMTLNEVTKVSRKGRLMRLPDPQLGVKLLLSGSEYLENNWLGEISKLSVKSISDLNAPSLINFEASLQLDALAQLGSWLLIPQKLSLLKHRVLEATSFRINSINTLHDILINFFGFIPFGIITALLLTKVPLSFQRPIHSGLLVVFITFLCSFLLSFVIEYWQAWLVTRHSSLRDLSLNTLGGAAGAVSLVVLIRLQSVLNRKRAE
jgi:VanZ family protein